MNVPREGKIALELNYPGDGRIFLNFWNLYNGEDIVAQVIDGKLYVRHPNDVEPGTEVSFPEFLRRVEEKWDAIPHE